MLARLNARTLLLAAAGSIAVAVAIALWLQIPDSHTWEFALSVLTGIAIVLATLWLKATILRRIRIGQPATPKSMAILVPWIAVFWILVHLIQLLTIHVVERAGFWNSRLSARQRTLFTEPRLESWQNDAISTLLWFVLPGLLLPLIIETVSSGTLKTAARVYRLWQLWLTVGVATTLGGWLTGKLTTWHPSETVHGELLSAIARLSLLYALLLAIALIALAIISNQLARSATRQD